MATVNEFAESIGLQATRLKRYMMDSKARAEGRENVMTVLDLMTLYEYIYVQRESGPLGHEMWQLLGRQQFRDKLPFLTGEKTWCFTIKRAFSTMWNMMAVCCPSLKVPSVSLCLFRRCPTRKAYCWGSRMGRCIKEFLENKLP